MISDDIAYIKSILPSTYKVNESKKKGSVHCKSETGIRKGVDEEDNEHWGYIVAAIKNHFGGRFQEIFHNTCFCHVDFTVHLKQ